MELDLDIDKTVDEIGADLFGEEEPSVDEEKVVVEEPPVEEPAKVDEPVVVKEGEVILAPEAPKSWPKELVPEFSKLPKNVQEFWGKREADYAAGIAQYKQNAEYGKSLHDVIAPYAPMLESEGVDAVRGVKFLLNAHYVLRTADASRKSAFFQQLAKDYGVEWSPAATDPNAPAKDPAVEALERRLAATEANQNANQQATLVAKQAELTKTVDAFANDPAHSYFDECSDDIAKLINAGYTLEDAYEKAVWANPATRAKEQVRISKETEEATRKAAEEAALAARKRSKGNIKDVPTDRKGSPSTLGSMDDTIRSKLREINGRT